MTPSYILRLTRAAFRQEAEDLLAELDTSLLRLEAAPTDRSLIDRVFRVMHTMKGSGATAGFVEVSAVLHDVEDIFNNAREGRIAISTTIIDSVLPITDLIKRMLGANEGDMPGLVAEGARFVQDLKSAGPRAREDGHIQCTNLGIEDACDSRIWVIRFRPYEGFFRTGNDPLIFIREVLRLGVGAVKADVKPLEAISEFDPESSHLSWEIQLAGEFSEPALREVFAFAEGEADIDIQRIPSAEAWVLPGEAYFGKQMLADFLEECAEDIAEIERHALVLEQGSDPEARLGELRRILHNLKGLVRLLLGSAQRVTPPRHPLRAIGELCHAAEETLAHGGANAADEDRFRPLFPLVDTIRGLSHCVLVGGTESWPAKLLAELGACAPNGSGPYTTARPAESIVLEVARQYQDVVSAVIREQPGGETASEDDLRMLSRALRTLGNAAEYEGETALSSHIALAATTCNDGSAPTRWVQIREHVRHIDKDLTAYRERCERATPGAGPSAEQTGIPGPASVSEPASSQVLRTSARPIGKTVSLRPGPPAARSKQPGAPKRRSHLPQAATGHAQAGEIGHSIRVDQAKLDRLMQAISELLVAKNALPVLAHRVEEQDRSTAVREIKDLGVRIAHIADDLQDAMRQVRMLPIRTVFQKFPRMIRDLARGMGKQVQLIVSGEEIELDRTVLEQIGDPLVHLIRNAVDHGIEAPEDRLRHGKAELGTIGLEVLADGTDVVIRVSDDGRGMDPDRLRNKAVERRLLTRSAADALTDPQALDLVFIAGFSTAEAITSVSGRGVGMDVVQNNVRALRGNISLTSTIGCGTTFTIRLPSSVMVSRGVLVESGGEQYVLPIETVREMVKLRALDIRSHRDQAIAAIRGDVCRVVLLADLLGQAGNPHAGGSDGEANAMLIATSSGNLAVVVDRLVAEVDVIAKPLPIGYDRNHIFRGATILGDGRVALVLEPGGFDRLACSEQRSTAGS